VTTRRMFLRQALAGASILALAACSTSGGTGPMGTAASRWSEAAPASITMGYFPNVTHAPALVAVATNGFRDASPSVTFDSRVFNAGPSLIEAMFAGAVDLGYVGPSPAINGYTQSKGQALRVIAGAMSGGASFVVRPLAHITSPADLAGKRIASPQLGNTQDVALRFYLQQHSLKTRDKGGTVEVLPTANAEVVNLFRQGQIDGAWVPEPWASALVLQAQGTVFVDERTLWPRGQFSSVCVVATPKLLARRPDLVKGFLGAHLSAIELMHRDPERAKQLSGDQLTRLTAQAMPADVLDRSFSMQDATYDPLSDSILTAADRAFALGLLGNTQPDLAGLFDLGLLSELLAAAELDTV
jgi:NitT/TauT family transport system substrate-binding protein